MTHITLTHDPAVYRREMRRNQPVILRGAIDHWPARHTWEPGYFRRFAHVPIRVSVWDEGNWLERAEKVRMSLGDFLDGLEARRQIHYFTLHGIFTHIPQLAADVAPVEPFMGLPRMLRAQQLAPTIWFGSAATVTGLHYDLPHNLLVQLHGRKRFLLFSPPQWAQLHYPMDADALAKFRDPKAFTNFSPVDPDRPDLTRYPNFARAQGTEVVLEPGDMLFIPSLWWHYVQSLDISITMSFMWMHPRMRLRSALLTSVVYPLAARA